MLVLAGTLLAAFAGGKAGERYHRRVDAAGIGERDRIHDRDGDGVDDRRQRREAPLRERAPARADGARDKRA